MKKIVLYALLVLSLKGLYAMQEERAALKREDRTLLPGAITSFPIDPEAAMPVITCCIRPKEYVSAVA